ncbi:hypothetical protein [Corallococcus praedator]|uniref:hypothetical protein n=1 Tax=Corallococcus praedator TaxID=2316724 RepID=UPI001ABFEA7C|nr:hypothetical protein [Corallococcus praedator]
MPPVLLKPKLHPTSSRWPDDGLSSTDPGDPEGPPSPAWASLGTVSESNENSSEASAA